MIKLAIIVVCLLTACSAARTVPQESPLYLEACYERRVLELTNERRATEGLEPLLWHDELADVARVHSRDMYSVNILSHESTDGRTFDLRISDAGISWTRIAENVARGQRTPEQVVDEWMNSPLHRDNIMDEHLTHLGVGLYNNFWTQKFLADSG